MDNNYPSEKRDFNDNAAPQPQLFTPSQNQLYMNNNQNQENIYSKPIYPAKIQPNSNINQNQVNAYSKPICQPEGAQISQQYQQQNAIIVNQPRPIQGAVIIISVQDQFLQFALFVELVLPQLLKNLLIFVHVYYVFILEHLFMLVLKQ